MPVQLKAALLLVLSTSTLLCAAKDWPCTGSGCGRACVTPCDCPTTAPLCVQTFVDGKSECRADTPTPPRTIFFVHIPKTGGTTFKMAGTRAFGRESVCMDYGSESGSTSPLLREHLYHGGTVRYEAFVRAAREKCVMMTGHVPASKYVRFFGLRRTVAIIRRPFERKLSEYFHKQREVGYNGTFSEYLALRENSGTLLSRALFSKVPPIEALGFVGVMERFEESMVTFNAAYDVSLQFQHQNAGGWVAKDSEDPAITALFRADDELYARADALLTERRRMVDECQPYAHGSLESMGEREVWGWAWWARSNDPVSVVLSVDGVVVGKAEASEKHWLSKWGAPRNGLVGFTMTLPAAPRPGAVVRCEVATTRQLLGELTAPEVVSFA